MLKLRLSYYRLLTLDLPGKLINFEIQGYEDDVKIITDRPFSPELHTFTNKNAIGIITNNLVIFDIDERKLFRKFTKLPMDTAITKTPKGYHFYFINDTNLYINSYTKLILNDQKYNIDLFTNNQMIILPPTSVENHTYTWINSPFDHKIAKLSNYLWILEMFKNTKPFDEFKINNPKPQYCINNLSIKNTLIIIWDMDIKQQIRIMCGFIKIDDTPVGYLFKIGDNYFLHMLKYPGEYNNIYILINELIQIINKYNISSITTLTIGGSNTHNIGTILQTDSAFIYKLEDFSMDNDYIKGNKMLMKTKYYTDEPCVIAKKYIFDHEINHKYHIFEDNTFVILMVANKLNIPALCLVGITNTNTIDAPAQYIANINDVVNNIVDIFFKL